MPHVQLNVPLRRILLDLAPPKVAHGFGWSRVGDQFMLEAGYYDLKAVSDALRGAVEGAAEAAEPIDLFVTDRFILDAPSVLRLLEVIDALRKEVMPQPEKGAPANGE